MELTDSVILVLENIFEDEICKLQSSLKKSQCLAHNKYSVNVEINVDRINKMNK